MEQTYHGSCHCGAVTFEADIDLSAGTGKCNCSICTKVRGWSAMLKPNQFRLLRGGDHLGDYQFGGKTSHHQFCKSCGVHVFCKGYVEEIGGDYVAVHVNTLDDLAPADLVAAPLTYFDGRNDNWWEVPAETRHL